MLTKDTKLRFWCQKVLPLVYDDSLSYYELLNKVVLHLNQHTEDINALIDFYDTFSEEVEDVIQQMMEDGDFNEIVADTLGGIIAEEYDPTESYIIFDYCIFQSKLYRANSSTTGVFDPTKWDERTVGYDLTTIQNYIYSLNAGNVAYDPTASYDSGTVGNKIKNLAASDIANDSQVSGTNVDDALDTLNGAINNLKASNIENDSQVVGTDVDDALNTLNGATNNVQEQITPNVQTNTTATKSYAKGEYLTLNGELYRVTTAIANGATITPNTNAVKVNVCNELCYKPGDVIRWDNLYDCQVCARGMNADSCRIFVPLSKPIYANGFTINRLSGGVLLSGQSNVPIDTSDDAETATFSNLQINSYAGIGFLLTKTGQFASNSVGLSQVQYLQVTFT